MRGFALLRRWAGISAGLVLAVLLVGCDGRLDAKDIERTFSGNTVEGLTTDREVYWVYFSVTGDLYMLVEASGFTDTGRWWVTPEGRYCRQWAQVDAGRENCFNVAKTSDGFEFSQGETKLAVQFRDGNPKQLPRLR